MAGFEALGDTKPSQFKLKSWTDTIAGCQHEAKKLTTCILKNRKPLGCPYRWFVTIFIWDVMPDGSKFKDIDEFKQLLLKQRDQIARNLTTRLVTYATGAAPQTGDQAEIDAIVERIRPKGYGLRSLVHEVVGSRLFLRK